MVSYLVVPYAHAATDARVLLARLALVNMRAAGGSAPQIIPHHAGQWTLVGGEAASTSAALALFGARTGLDLTSSTVLSQFGLARPSVRPLQDARAADFIVLYLQTTATNLAALAAAINANLGAGGTDGVLVEAAAVAAADAASRIGPFPAPSDGWRGVIVDRVYGGRLPGAMDTTFPTLVNQIARRTQSRSDRYQLALQNLPDEAPPGPAPQPEARLVGLEVVDGARSEGDNAYAALYDESRNVTVRAILEPSTASADGLTWTGGTPVSGSPDRCTVSRRDINRFGEHSTISATLGSTTRSLSLTIRPRLGRVTVTGADRRIATADRSETWIASYATDGSTVRIEVETEPNTENAREYLRWSGDGEEGPRDSSSVRTVPRGRLSAPDRPAKVRVEVNPHHEVNVFVVPTIASVQPVGGNPHGPYGGTDYEIDYTNHATFNLQATTNPNDGGAHAFLHWSTGASATDRVQLDRFPEAVLGTFTGYWAEIRVAGDASSRTPVRISVIPTVTRVQAAAGAGISGPHDGQQRYDVDYQAPVANYNLEAVTDPVSATADAYLNWSTGANGTNTVARPRDAIDNAGAYRDYWAEIRTANGTYSRQTARVIVLPTLTGFACTGYVLDPGGNPYSYAVPGQLRVPNDGTVTATVTATTVPNNATAWAHLNWTGTAGAVGTANVQSVDLLNAVPVTAQIGHGAAQQALAVRAPQAWPASGLQLDVNQITFGGGSAVVRDDRPHVNTPFGRTWDRVDPLFGLAIAHANQSPQTYVSGNNVDEAAVIRVTNRPNGNLVGVNVRATAFVVRSNGAIVQLRWTWGPLTINQVGPATFNLANFQAPQALPGEVVHADPLYMFWEMQMPAGGNWILFDVTSHMFYVTLAAPGQYRLYNGGALRGRNYFTLLAISCLAANGENNVANMAPRLFAAFRSHPTGAAAPGLDRGTGVNISLVRKRYAAYPNLAYWNPRNPPTPPPASTPGQSVADMFGHSRSNASCKAFAEMFIAMAAVHGVGGLNLVLVEPDTGVVADATGFLVRDWTFHAPPAANGAAFTHVISALAVAGRATFGPIVVGQNNANPPSAFGCHFIVLRTLTGRLYDPSYGAEAATRQLWVPAAVAGLSRPRIPNPWWGCFFPCMIAPQDNAGYSTAAGAVDTIIKLTDQRTDTVF